ncbi:hypothetical protein RHGRI_030731 [Rhododendron griersonianum]|nr:hypothetical protein RHGRI_030731 [Rhododendron griersonianum]
MEDFEQTFSFPIFDIETDPEFEAAMLNLSQYYLEPTEEPPVLTMEEMLAQEHEHLLRAETAAKKSYEMWLRELFGVVLPSNEITM